MLSDGHQLLYVAVTNHEQNHLQGLILAHSFRELYPAWHRRRGEAQQAVKQVARQETELPNLSQHPTSSFS